VSKVDILSETNREMMLEFSSLCVGRLNNHLPLKLFLSPFQRFFDANVFKEIEKDRLIIEHASTAFEKGKDRTDVDLDKLFEMTVKVDNGFLEKLSNPFFSIEVRYDDFAQVRKKRMVTIVNIVFDLHCNWNNTSTFADIVKSTYAEQNYREILSEILHLYNVETRLLNNSITVRGPAGAAKDLISERLFVIMEETARDIVVAYARKVYVD
jgi:hypothetical protein